MQGIQLLLMQVGMCMLAPPIFLEAGTALVCWCANGGCASSLDTIPSASSQHHRAVVSVSPARPALCLLPGRRKQPPGHLGLPVLLHRPETIQESEQSRGGDGHCIFGRENQTASGLSRSSEVLFWLQGGGNRAPFVSLRCSANRNGGSRHHLQSVIV